MKQMLRLCWFGMLLLGFMSNTLQAQNTRKYEYRAVWFTTVGNYDWPTDRNATPATQQAEMIQMLDKLKSMNINVILFHARPQGDAFYQSSIEPWSYYLTGEQGKAPNPLWDPLDFLIKEGHKRGMEVHAWINPFRSHTATSTVPRSAKHVSNTHSDWLLQVGTTVIVNPGIPEARKYIVDVLADIATRYNIDGLHYDDFFYPYDDINKNNEDALTYDKYGKTLFADIKDWRRDNINQFVKDLDTRLKVIAQSKNTVIKHGVSPFGIWRSGTPAGIVGLSARDVIFCDAVEWLRKDTASNKEPWIDYLTPQLYWKIGGSQDYKSLVNWWKTQMNDRHFYPGLAIYRAEAATQSGTLFSLYEIPDQVRYNRDNGVLGETYFRTQNLTKYSSQGFGDFLKDFFYKIPALTPSMAWKDQRKPNPPQRLDYLWNGEEPVLFWGKSADLTAEKAPTRFYAIYRTISATEPDMKSVIADERNLVAVTSETTFKDKALKQGQTFWYFVTAVSPNSIESVEKVTIKLEGRSVTANDETLPQGLSLSQNFPNPFSNETNISFHLEKTQRISLKIYNSLGQEISCLKDQELISSGAQQALWNGNMQNGNEAPSGLYLYVLALENGQRMSKRMMKM